MTILQRTDFGEINALALLVVTIRGVENYQASHVGVFIIFEVNLREKHWWSLLVVKF